MPRATSASETDTQMFKCSLSNTRLQRCWRHQSNIHLSWNSFQLIFQFDNIVHSLNEPILEHWLFSIIPMMNEYRHILGIPGTSLYEFWILLRNWWNVSLYHNVVDWSWRFYWCCIEMGTSLPNGWVAKYVNMIDFVFFL